MSLHCFSLIMTTALSPHNQQLKVLTRLLLMTAKSFADFMQIFVTYVIIKVSHSLQIKHGNKPRAFANHLGQESAGAGWSLDVTVLD